MGQAWPLAAIESFLTDFLTTLSDNNTSPTSTQVMVICVQLGVVGDLYGRNCESAD